MIDIIYKKTNRHSFAPIQGFRDLIRLELKPYDLFELPTGNRFIILKRVYSMTPDGKYDIWGYILFEVTRHLSLEIYFSDDMTPHVTEHKKAWERGNSPRH